MTKEERLQKRLQHLHKHFKESGSKVYEWVVVYDSHPNDARLVDIWVKEEGKDQFGRRGRFAYGVWLDTRGKVIRENVYAWRDFE